MAMVVTAAFKAKLADEAWIGDLILRSISFA